MKSVLLRREILLLVFPDLVFCLFEYTRPGSQVMVHLWDTYYATNLLGLLIITEIATLIPFFLHMALQKKKPLLKKAPIIHIAASCILVLLLFFLGTMAAVKQGYLLGAAALFILVQLTFVAWSVLKLFKKDTPDTIPGNKAC